MTEVESIKKNAHTPARCHWAWTKAAPEYQEGPRTLCLSVNALLASQVGVEVGGGGVGDAGRAALLPPPAAAAALSGQGRRPSPLHNPAAQGHPAAQLLAREVWSWWAGGRWGTRGRTPCPAHTGSDTAAGT